MSWLDEFGERHGPVVGVLASSLAQVERRFSEQIESDLECVRELCGRVERYRGKMLRPSLTMLAGMAAKGDASAPAKELITLAAVVEMIHVATLVHDDVLDEAEVRRQRPTISKLRGNEAAVILGDYLISSAFHLCSSLDDQRVALRIGEITTRVCEGELLQLHHRQDCELDEETYFEIIERKTASLIGIACEQGGAFSGASPAVQRDLYEFGARLGIAFQIQDDLLDLLGVERVVGKSLGKDLEKGKLTLPLIHHLAVADAGRRQQSLDLLEGLWQGEGAHEAPDSSDGATLVAELTDVRHEVQAALEHTGSVEYASQIAQNAVVEAKSRLASLPASPARALLEDLADAALRRDR